MDNGNLRELHTFDLVDLGVLASGQDREFDFAVALAARSARAPVATFASVDFGGSMLRVRAHTGFGPCGPKVADVPLEASLAYKAGSDPDLIAIPDVARDPRTAAHPFLRVHGIQSLLGAPVFCPADEIVALLAVHDTLPRIWNAEDRNALLQVAHFCTQVILLRAALKTLSLISKEGVRTGFTN